MTTQNKKTGTSQWALDHENLLHFGTDNAKLKGTRTATFSLPAGYTCPGACDCLAWFDPKTRKLHDGPNSKFRCFAASNEAAYTNVSKSVHRNLALLKEAKTVENMAELLSWSLPSLYYHNIRVHADGDFFSADYFAAWMETARRNRNRLFYAYTKNIPAWLKLRKLIPDNFVLTASLGGKWDAMALDNNLRYAKVVFHPEEAEQLGLSIDHNDSLARDAEHGSFALLLHGTGPAGSEHSKALKRMRKEGIRYAYSRKSRKEEAQ
jgi:hypothetical protein